MLVGLVLLAVAAVVLPQLHKASAIERTGRALLDTLLIIISRRYLEKTTRTISGSKLITTNILRKYSSVIDVAASKFIFNQNVEHYVSTISVLV